MKNYLFPLLAFFILASSCSSDFKVGADYKDVSIVYCLLSKSDTAHFVKISKAFYDEKKNNLIIAQNPDSLYFSNLEVQLQELNNGNVVNSFGLTKVELHAEGIIKDTGTFATTPSYAYKLKRALDPSKRYKLVIKNLSTGRIVEGETNIINDANMQFTNPGPTSKLNFSEASQDYNFGWGAPASAAFFDLYMRFYYQEKNTNTNVTTYKFADVSLLRNVPATGGQVTAPLQGLDFYRALNSSLGVTPSYLSRYVDTPDLFIVAGGEELKTYIEVNSAQGGITFDQIKPNYTNLSTDKVLRKDVYGIFSSRATRYQFGVQLSKATVDSIIYGSYTKNLNFVGVSSQ